MQAWYSMAARAAATARHLGKVGQQDLIRWEPTARQRHNRLREQVLPYSAWLNLNADYWLDLWHMIGQGEDCPQ